MITNIQRRFLEQVNEGKFKKQDDPHKWSVYHKRMRERIDTGMDNLEWLAKNAPDILIDAEYEINEYGYMKRRRLKTLMFVIKLLYPDNDVELVKLTKSLGFRPV